MCKSVHTFKQRSTISEPLSRKFLKENRKTPFSKSEPRAYPYLFEGPIKDELVLRTQIAKRINQIATTHGG